MDVAFAALPAAFGDEADFFPVGAGRLARFAVAVLAAFSPAAFEAVVDLEVPLGFAGIWPSEAADRRGFSARGAGLVVALVETVRAGGAGFLGAAGPETGV